MPIVSPIQIAVSFEVVMVGNMLTSILTSMSVQLSVFKAIS